jgi:D-alanyl-D-alanine carboxypeptidase
MFPINFTTLYRPLYAIALITALLLTAETGAQTVNTAKLDTLFARLDANNKATVTVYKNGKVLYNKSIGYKKIEGTAKQAADVHTKYRIGSITKMFTAAMIFELVDEKKLALDTKLDTFFPKIANANIITIGNMLNHHSGIHNFTNDDAYMTYHTSAKTQAELLEIFYKMPADFAPGEKAEYSNTNYVLLGYIIEKITGKSYAHELKTRITNKIGLKETYYGGPADVKKNEAYSYSFEGKNWQHEQETNMDIPHGAGAIVATSTDLTKFATALFQGKLFSDSLLKKMKTDTDEYGYGCFEMPFYDQKSYGHTGGIDGFSSMLAYFPSDSLAVAIVSNGMSYSLNEVMINVLNIVYYENDYAIPTFTSIALNPDKLAAYEGLYSAPGFPLKITIKAVDDKLTAQATGQNSFVLDAKSKTLFKFDSAGITIDFIITDGGTINQFKFKQSGLDLLFTKEK